MTTAFLKFRSALERIGNSLDLASVQKFEKVESHKNQLCDLWIA